MLLSWFLRGAPWQRGQTVAVLNDHVSAAAAAGRQQAAGGVRVRPLGQPQLSSSGHTFMSEPLENKVGAVRGWDVGPSWTRGPHVTLHT